MEREWNCEGVAQNMCVVIHTFVQTTDGVHPTRHSTLAATHPTCFKHNNLLEQQAKCGHIGTFML